MFPYRDSKALIVGLAVFFLVLIGYALFEAHGVLFGPRINVETGPRIVTEEYITIEGSTERISSLAMNGREIPVSESGDFRQSFLLAPGYNVIELSASDKAGRTTSRTIELIFQPTTTPVTTLPSSKASGTATTSATTTEGREE